MKPNLLGLALLAATLGCRITQPIVRPAPLPAPEQAAAARAVQERWVAVPATDAFPLILDLLLDRGLLVVAADRDLGLVSFRGAWRDLDHLLDPDITVEGTLRVRTDGKGLRLRLLLMGRWEIVDHVEGGQATVGRIAPVGPEEYRRLLDGLAEGLARPTP